MNGSHCTFINNCVGVRNMRSFVLLIYSAFAVSAGLVAAIAWYYGSGLADGLVKAPVWVIIVMGIVVLANFPLVFYFQLE